MRTSVLTKSARKARRLARRHPGAVIQDMSRKGYPWFQVDYPTEEPDPAPSSELLAALTELGISNVRLGPVHRLVIPQWVGKQ